MGLFDSQLYDEIDPTKKAERFNCDTDESELVRKVIAGDPNKFLRTNGG